MKQIPPISKEEVQKILDRTNRYMRTEKYLEREDWEIQVPSCPIYDGNSLCFIWEGWIELGRKLYSGGKRGYNEYLGVLKRVAPLLSEEDITAVLNV